jgi:drug/metabolite transporter (DMT)-like permease
LFTVLTGDQFSLIQWISVFLVILASMLLKDSKEGLSWFEVGWAFCCCLGYAISDFSIQILIQQIDPEQSLRASLMAASLTYMGASIFVFYHWRKVMVSTWQDWKWASGVAFGWYTHMLFLYMAIAFIGTVHSVILQSTRSLWAVLMGVVLMRLGFVALEADISFGMRMRQFAAALLTMAAIVLFQINFK